MLKEEKKIGEIKSIGPIYGKKIYITNNKSNFR